ncbi:arabinose-5-phosphate isomerase KdsD [Thorsellia anophelis]|uniref:Arabinose 5-phosphate isomerase n=1 Tax=Thorsellia anophelis DSM 18579 TaxID=1123402 RepID=A0A1I0A990_9GAMM|nr:arabinose-5-phosphate isomerase KdsD [Thorsellia anophelis]SES90748.1 arabinose-5-phosphate isomerase [Thorsellia anophelis DSM 18579]
MIQETNRLTQSTHNFIESAKRTIKIELEGINELFKYVNDDFQLACERIFATKGKVIVMGIGKSGHIGKKMAATFASTGTPAFFVHPAEASHGDLGMVTPSDILILISNSGESPEITALLPTLKRLQIPMISMTNSTESTLAKASDVHICIKTPKEACPLGLAPTSSTTATLVMGDAMAISLLEARGFNSEDFALSHPGGALGRKLLLKVHDIMHTHSAMPIVNVEASLKDALVEITQKNLGLVVICNEQNKIEGVFTDGDLRRIFETDIDLRTASILEVMTKGGINIHPNALAVDALNLMQAKHITALIVAENQKLVGVLHMHDLLRAGVV